MNPKYITLHCSATNPAKPFTKADLHHAHVVKKKWSDIGYHYYIRTDGTIHPCRPMNRSGAHVKGHNTDNIGICLEGGVDANGKAEANFTDIQLEAAHHLTEELAENYCVEHHNVKGHRDWFPDLNGDGVIDRRDWLKECPCFDVAEWYAKGKEY